MKRLINKDVGVWIFLLVILCSYKYALASERVFEDNLKINSTTAPGDCNLVVVGSQIGATVSGNYISSNFQTAFVLTDASDVIISSSSSGTFTAPQSPGEYRIYAVNYSTDGAQPTLNANLAISAIGGDCVDVSAVPKCFEVINAPVCMPATVGGTLAANVSGNNTDAGFATVFVLTDSQNLIITSSSTPGFTAPNQAGEYRIYAVNYETGGVAPNFSEGLNINDIGGGCVSISAIPKCFDVRLEECVAPVIAIVEGSSSTICSDGSTSLTALGCAGGVINWSDGSTGNAITVSPDSDTNYTATCTVGTCVSVASNEVTVTVTTTVVPENVGASKLKVTAGESTELTADCLTGTPIWFSDVLLQNQLSSTTVSPTTSTTYYVVCGIGDCYPSDSVRINVCQSCLTATVVRRQ